MYILYKLIDFKHIMMPSFSKLISLVILSSVHLIIVLAVFCIVCSKYVARIQTQKKDVGSYTICAVM